MKKIISILLVTALLLTLMPLSAFAGEAVPVVTQLTSISVTIDPPMAGREADFEVYPRSEPVNGIRTYVEQTKYSNTYHAVSWWDETDKCYLEEGDTHILGHEYTVTVYVITNNPFYYSIHSNVTATLNGNKANFFTDGLYKGSIVYHFPACEAAPADITNVAVGGCLQPVAGERPMFAVSMDEERVEADLSAGSAFINGVAWFEPDTMKILNEDDVFEAGKTYKMFVTLRTKGNYRFATSDGKNAVKGTINGLEAENITYQETGDQSRNLKLEYTFVCAEADAVGGGTMSLRVNIDYPVGGKKMSFSPQLIGEHCEMADVNENGFVNGVKWTNRTTGGVGKKGSTFAVGGDYTVSVLVRAESILKDETCLGYLLQGDGSVRPYLYAYVNGRLARVEHYGDFDTAQMVQVIFDFPACNETTQTVNTIRLSGVSAPVFGQTPDTKGTLTLEYEEAIPDSSQSVVLNWCKGDLESGEIFAIMDDEERFEIGYRYYIGLALDLGSVTALCLNQDRTEFDGQLTVVGAEKTETYYRNGMLSIAAMYEPFATYPDAVDVVDVIGVVPPVIGQRPCTSASLTTESMQKVQIESVTWFENGEFMAPDATFKENGNYVVTVTVKINYPYRMPSDKSFPASINGYRQLFTGVSGDKGIYIGVDEEGIAVSMHYGYLKPTSYVGVTDYVEAGDVMRPAPGQHPDFTADITSPYTQFGGITWCELDDNGAVVKQLTKDDVFRKDTRYRLEFRVLPSEGRSINLDARGATLNNETVQYYYLPGEAVVLYAEYDTANCISVVNIEDVQYPLGGKTPDTDVVISTNGVKAVKYASGSYIDWCVENASGFGDFSGKFKANARHQAYVKLEAEDGYWFATDSEGDLAVHVTFDYAPMSFAYTTDTYLVDGACNEFEVARTYDVASKADGIFIDGIWLTDDMYMSDVQCGAQTADTVDTSEGYAHYRDGVLTLCNFRRDCNSDYDAISTYNPLTICLEGQSELYSASVGINTSGALTLTGDGVALFAGTQYGVFAMDEITVDSGTWVAKADIYDGMWLYSDLTVNGGYLTAIGKTCGLYGDDWPTVAVNGGTLLAASYSEEDAIGWCDVQIANGAAVTVSTDVSGADAVMWDGETGFSEYAYVAIAFEEEEDNDVLLGDVNLDGAVNMRDAMLLYTCVSSGSALTAQQEKVGDMDESGGLNMRDVMKLYALISNG